MNEPPHPPAWLDILAAAGPPRRAPLRRRVLVLGAGAAGLTAARLLHHLGFDVTVLEARDRIGGRVWPRRWQQATVECGAAWIQGDRSNPLLALADRLGLPTRREHTGAIALRDAADHPLSSDRLRATSRLHRRIDRMLLDRGRSIAPDHDIPISEALPPILHDLDLDPDDPLLRWWLAWWIECEEAADAHRISLRAYAAETDTFGQGVHYLPGGFGPLLDALAADLDIRLHQPAHAIAARPDGVTAETPTDTLHADYAIITAPLGVLRHGAINFDPPLPDAKRAAIEQLEMGTANKIIARFPRPFWPDQPRFFASAAAWADDGILVWQPAPQADQPILIGWLHGHAAQQLEQMSHDQLEATALRSIARTFGTTPPHPDALFATAWQADPHAHGAYSFTPAGVDIHQRNALAAPAHDRLLFAGEATVIGEVATVHGALLSGLREANRLARDHNLSL